MWAALEAIAARTGKRGEVVIPDIACPCVLEVVLASGFTPRFAAVDTERFYITPQTIEPILSEKTSAVIAIHLFGYVAPIDKLELLLKNTGIYLIEDAVQAVGGYLPAGIPAGCGGDFSVISFDASKIIRGQGGILFYDDESWTPFLLNILGKIQSDRATASDRLSNSSWRDLYHGLGQALRLGIITPIESANFVRSILPKYRHLLLYPFDNRQSNLDIIQDQWESLPNRICSRNHHARSLQDAFSGFPVRCPSVKHGDAIWRYTVEFRNRVDADHFVLAMRNNGGLVSQLYYPLHQFFAPEQQLATANVAHNLVNLWVDETITDSYVNLTRKVLKSIFDKRDQI